jgi:hypothetical protein
MFVFLVFVLAMYTTRKLRKQIRCRYTSRSKQTYEKFISAQASCVIFEGKKFYIIPKCVKHHWFEKGLSQLFPTFMPEMDFIWNSEYPVDPDTGEPVMISPEVEATIDQEAAFREYAGSQRNALLGTKGKLGGFTQWLPWIALAAVVILFIYVYPKMQDIGIIKKTLSDILMKIGQ